ncbi:hypothetical protein A2W14_05015 [Candidatus Gottesmanbacteria bacterium RBG_16_37_8]|uniref:Methyltransferase type 11 domain-containing protein n=1 Tax=Candidatus Gottesmanbacteria bacterium RBG_16_37_8 TaxID=1798371 RepID=A0A1F5YVF6_9BACT|nr:MAG: hypothetical protein A2W14_05015 [Candidatus Gottesmanbacteria bacterium RBG_16_37_8]
MSFYDFYYYKSHPDWLNNLFIRYNQNILFHLLSFFPDRKQINLLELGPGKGYFYEACQKWDKKISYHAFDRNDLILKSLNIKSVFKGKAPNLPLFKKKFDIIFSAYLIEHLKSGEEVFELIRKCKKNLSPGGLIVFLAPDALSLKMEFWNMDYTHSFPTTKRNVAMAFYDNQLSDLNIHDYYDFTLWLTNKSNLWPICSFLIRITMIFYDYRLFNFLMLFSFRKTINRPENWFYRLFCFTKVKNLMFIARV